MKDNLETGLKQAIARSGKLKAKCPPMDTMGSAVWNAIMYHSNFYKVHMSHMIFYTKDQNEVYNYVEQMGKVLDLTTFDTDGNLFRSLNLIK